jgi:hypothetical protein
MIELIRSERVTPTEAHFEVKINEKIVQFAKWLDDDFYLGEIIKGQEELTEDEEEELIDFIYEQAI